MSDYRIMRILLFFDLPFDDAVAVKRYTRFRKLLIQSRYQMLQYSVYCKICPNKDTVKWHLDYLKKTSAARRLCHGADHNGKTISIDTAPCGKQNRTG
ncbi:MAG: CRISPR-associated endonuclease Cas2 [Selenomonadales bacterium]|nr:CRISPR-associated endonuclease Cas2 [Selenomonadales bacterium]